MYTKHNDVSAVDAIIIEFRSFSLNRSNFVTILLLLWFAQGRRLQQPPIEPGNNCQLLLMQLFPPFSILLFFFLYVFVCVCVDLSTASSLGWERDCKSKPLRRPHGASKPSVCNFDITADRMGLLLYSWPCGNYFVFEALIPDR